MLSGEISILDGQFIFDEFPYPIVGASGRLVIGRDANMLAAALGVVLVTGCVLWLRRTTPGATAV